MTSIYSPRNIEFLLWCYIRVEPFPTRESPAALETVKRFLALGVIQHDGDGLYSTTERGKAWVNALCNVPPPKQVYVDEMGRVLNSQ